MMFETRGAVYPDFIALNFAFTETFFLFVKSRGLIPMQSSAQA